MTYERRKELLEDAKARLTKSGMEEFGYEPTFIAAYKEAIDECINLCPDRDISVAFMTSPIGNLTVDSRGMRKAVDEIGFQIAANHDLKEQLYAQALELANKTAELTAKTAELEALKVEHSNVCSTMRVMEAIITVYEEIVKRSAME